MEHHVYFWLKEEHQNDAARAGFEAALAKLCTSGNIAEPRWGKPAATAERPVIDRSWDYGLSLKFATLEDHNRYQGDDPVHAEFVKAHKDWWARVQVMDLE